MKRHLLLTETPDPKRLKENFYILNVSYIKIYKNKKKLYKCSQTHASLLHFVR